MPTRARIITSPAAEDVVRLGDGRVRMRVYGAGRGARDPRVAGDEQRLTVLAGRMAVTCNGTLSVLEAGQAIAIPPGVEHAWWSTRAGELCVEIASGAADGHECVASARTRRWNLGRFLLHDPGPALVQPPGVS